MVDLGPLILGKLDRIDALMAKLGPGATVTLWSEVDGSPYSTVYAEKLADFTAGARELVAEHPTAANSNGSLYCEPCDDASMQTGDVRYSGYPCTTMFLLAKMLGVKVDG